jgi:hypothetical protein
MPVSLFDEAECPPVEKQGKVSVSVPPGRYRVSLIGKRHVFTASVLLDVLKDHGDGTVTVRTTKTRYINAGYVNRVPVRGDDFERVFTPVGETV